MIYQPIYLLSYDGKPSLDNLLRSSFFVVFTEKRPGSFVVNWYYANTTMYGHILCCSRETKNTFIHIRWSYRSLPITTIC